MNNFEFLSKLVCSVGQTFVPKSTFVMNFDSLHIYEQFCSQNTFYASNLEETIFQFTFVLFSCMALNESVVLTLRALSLCHGNLYFSVAIARRIS